MSRRTGKGAVRVMSKNDALTCAPENIRVNSIHPGFTVYLASDQAKWVTGSELVIDGGYTAR